MKLYNIAILGATGSVGLEMLKILEERDLPIKNLYLFASKKSSGKIINYRGEKILVQELNEKSFISQNEKIDIVLSALSNELSKKFLPIAVKENIFVIDNSSAFRLNDDVPLIIPEVNAIDIKNHKNLVSNPNCATIIALVAINNLHKYANVNSMIVSTYQAVSGAGIKGIEELDNQVMQISNNLEITKSCFNKQIAFNIIPQIGDFNDLGYSSEEMKLQNEGRKILNNPNLKVNCTCVRIPVYRSHSESITLYFDREISVKKAEEILKDSEGIKFIENLDIPTPLDATNQDLVLVGRLRKNILSDDDKSLTLFCVGDQLRKGAAGNAIDILQLYINELK